MVPHSYVLCSYVCGLQRYGHLLRVITSLVFNLEQKLRKKILLLLSISVAELPPVLGRPVYSLYCACLT